MNEQIISEESIMTMKTEKSGRFKIILAGSGSFTIDWGDGSTEETHSLCFYDEDFADEDNREKFTYCHIFPNSSSRTITVTAECITHLMCIDNRVTSLNVCKHKELLYLNCFNNQLLSLDVCSNLALQILYCGDNHLTCLDVSKNTSLIRLSCNNNQLTSIDVSKNTVLSWLDCKKNQISNLDVSKNTSLEKLFCDDNLLTNLYVCNNAALKILYCHDNQLTDLNLSQNTALRDLNCSENLLTSLDVSQNTLLLWLACQHNQLTSLDVSACTMLKEVKCNSNKFTCLDDFLAHLLVCIRNIQFQQIESNKYEIIFPMYMVDGGMYKIFLVEEFGKFYLSDEGTTYAELEKVFEIAEPDVIKNLVAILKQYGCRKHPSSNAFTIECTPYDVHLKIGYLIQSISFMLNMKIFYV